MRVWIVWIVLTACGTDVRTTADGPVASSQASLAAIRSEIFTSSCGFGSCHAGATPAAHLDLRDGDVCRALTLHASCLFPDKLLVVPGKPEKSFLLAKLTGSLVGAPTSACADSNEPMPYGAPPLAADKIALIEDWIRAGAPCERAGDSQPDGGIAAAADVSSLTATSTTIRAGEHTRITIKLAHAAPAGGQILDLDVDDATVLGVPSAVHVDAGVSVVDVDVIGKRPAHPVRITVTSGTSAKSIAIGVTGLLLSEIEFDAEGTDDGYEWIEIANTSDVAIDLGAYSIGSGRTSYTYSIAQLSGIVPAHGCFVVGGPTSATSNGAPVYSQTFNFSPDLVNGSATNGQAAGFALFDAVVTQLVPTAVPLDAVLCGQNNLAGLVDGGGHVAVPSCPDVIGGHSVTRVSQTAWASQPTPTPNLCSLQ
jgi:hypothetical protein